VGDDAQVGILDAKGDGIETDESFVWEETPVGDFSAVGDGSGTDEAALSPSIVAVSVELPPTCASLLFCPG